MSAWFQKISITLPWKITENSSEEGDLNDQNFKEMCEPSIIEWGSNLKTFLGGIWMVSGHYNDFYSGT